MGMLKNELKLKFEKSTVKQADKNEVDINTIMRKYQKNGTLPQMIQSDPKFGDFSDVPSYHEACNTVIFAQMQFDALPLEAKKRFKNDPAEMLTFCADPANADEMVKLGLAVKKTSDDTPVINDDKTTIKTEVKNA